ncbi:hypothetical protein OHO28_32995 [Streptomyces europaeiscabiei]|uniref:hypothetical protein n=1 Tax=Streptomyces europaeiscabiei TaxID=146819 RepID=UPI002E17C500
MADGFQRADDFADSAGPEGIADLDDVDGLGEPGGGEGAVAADLAGVPDGPRGVADGIEDSAGPEGIADLDDVDGLGEPGGGEGAVAADLAGVPHGPCGADEAIGPDAVGAPAGV